MEIPFVSKKKYDEVVYKLECLLCHATGGRLSKHTYTLQTMEYAVTDYIQECCDDAEENAKATAVRELAERLTACFCPDCDYSGYEIREVIDQITKEM